ncbi:hypothetical protein HMPREF1548_02667 [Clostridium sp. KLE 1755]|nr:hypothetical protein HMPREF1548_02667 [Clostridium sp. KLE 1755]
MQTIFSSSKISSPAHLACRQIKCLSRPVRLFFPLFILYLRGGFKTRESQKC